MSKFLICFVILCGFDSVSQSTAMASNEKTIEGCFCYVLPKSDGAIGYRWTLLANLNGLEANPYTSFLRSTDGEVIETTEQGLASCMESANSICNSFNFDRFRIVQ